MKKKSGSDNIALKIEISDEEGAYESSIKMNKKDDTIMNNTD